ncbi:MAG: hypothetical protein AAGC91_04335 [Pseudomonadota bacterium]
MHRVSLQLRPSPFALSGLLSRWSLACAALLFSACSANPTAPTAIVMDGPCFVNERALPPTRTCRVLSSSDWEALGLHAADPQARAVLAALTERIEAVESSRNFYPSFINAIEAELPVLIQDDDGWALEALLESSADKTSCSHVRDMIEWLKESGDGDQAPDEKDKKHGHRCGNISIIHSLVRLGVLSPDEAFRGEHLNPDVVTLLDRFHGNEPGMTPDQQRRGYGHYSTPQRALNCLTTLPGKVSERGAVVRVARALSTTMASTKPRYDCSLAVHADKQEDDSPGYKHVEHVTGVRTSPDGEYLIDTLDGFHQGSGATDIPKTPARNVWGVGSRNGVDWVQLKNSTLESNRRSYSEIPPYWIEMRCCSLVENP